jgi:tetratricopeptide (TPR) repeat protein
MAWNRTRTITIAILTVFLCWFPRLPRTFAQHPQTQDPRSIFEHGQQALADQEYAVAEEDFDHLLRMGVRSAPTYGNLGVVYMRTNRLDAAIKAFLRAKALAPGLTGVDLNLGLAYFREGEFKKAGPYFAQVISADPGNVQAHYLKGTCDFMTDDFASAVDSLAPIMDREHDDLEYLFMLGISYGILKRAEDSQRVFERLVQAGGDTPHFHLLLGKAYLALGQVEKAESELQRAVASEPLPYAHYYLGVLAHQSGKLDLASAEFEKEIQVDPGNPWPYKDLAEIELDQQDASGAIVVLEKGIARNPEAPYLLGALGRAYLQGAEPVRAIAVLKQAIALDPKNGGYHYELGRAYLKTGHHAEATTQISLARKLTDENSQGQMEVLSRDRDAKTVPADLP